MSWFKSLFCSHNWEVIRETDSNWGEEYGKQGWWKCLLLQCKKCGTIKKIYIPMDYNEDHTHK